MLNIYIKLPIIFSMIPVFFFFFLYSTALKMSVPVVESKRSSKITTSTAATTTSTKTITVSKKKLQEVVSKLQTAINSVFDAETCLFDRILRTNIQKVIYKSIDVLPRRRGRTLDVLLYRKIRFLFVLLNTCLICLLKCPFLYKSLCHQPSNGRIHYIAEYQYPV